MTINGFKVPLSRDTRAHVRNVYRMGKRQHGMSVPAARFAAFAVALAARYGS